MTFTNTDCVEEDWTWYDVWGHVKWPVKKQVDEQVKWEVDAQPNLIKTKIKEEINK